MKLLATALIAFALPAFADDDAAEYAKLLSEAKISITEAIATAQTRAEGTAVSAELDRRLGKAVFEVEVMSGARLFDVRLDAETGNVIDVREDLND